MILAIRGVINNLAPDELTPALEAITDRLAEGGIVVFDNASLPDENEWFVNSRAMTPFADNRIESVLDDCGYGVTTHDGFDDADTRTVFVAIR